jgi:hypothetical protein
VLTDRVPAKWRSELGTAAAGTVGLLGSPAGQGALLAAAALHARTPRVVWLADQIARLGRQDPRVTELARQIVTLTRKDPNVPALADVLGKESKDPAVKRLAGEIATKAKEDPETAKAVEELAKLSQEDPAVKGLAEEVVELSSKERYKWVKVPAGAHLKMPIEGKTEYVAQSDMLLKDIAREELGRERNAQKIFNKNKDEPTPEEREKGYVKLELPKDLPQGAELSLPASDWPAWLAFLALAGFLLLVGTGNLLPPSPEAPAEAAPESNGAADTQAL